MFEVHLSVGLLFYFIVAYVFARKVIEPLIGKLYDKISFWIFKKGSGL